MRAPPYSPARSFPPDPPREASPVQLRNQGGGMNIRPDISLSPDNDEVQLLDPYAPLL